MGVERAALRLASRAKCFDFNFVAGQRIACTFDAIGQAVTNDVVMNLGHRAATGAHYQQVVRGARRVAARHKRVKRINPVNQAFFKQEVERPINRGRRGVGVDGTDLVKQFVRFKTAFVV